MRFALTTLSTLSLTHKNTMKNNNCPFLDSQNRCTHKKPLVKNRDNSKKLPNCPFSNPIKCELYNSWLNELKFIRTATKPLEIDIYDGHRLSIKLSKFWKKRNI